MKLNLITLALCVIVANAKDLPSFIKKCSRDDSIDKVTQCILAQAPEVQKYFVKGLPEYGLEGLDPYALGEVTVNAGTFDVTSTDTVLEGLSNIEIKDIVWDIQNLKGYIKLFGTVQVKGDYVLNGTVLLLPVNSKGKVTALMRDLNIRIDYDYKIVKGDDGEEHWVLHKIKINPEFGTGKFILTNLLGGGAVGKSLNEVFNENYSELINEIGPTYVKVISKKIVDLINKFYSQIPLKQVF